jgi:signal transduction histidine kinase
MKLVVKYNLYAVSVMILVFIVSSIGSYFLIKKALTKELDISLLRVKARIETYIKKNQKLPILNSFDDETVSFKATNEKTIQPYFTTVQKYIKEQNKLHISRKLSYGVRINSQNYLISIISPLEGTRHMLIAIFNITLATIFILISSVLLINRIIMGKLWRPFYVSINQLRGFNISNPHQLNFPETNIKEFNFLIENLKTNTEKSVESYQILKEFTENASHEIQTPLAITRSKLDLLIQDDGLSSEQSEHLIVAYEALRRLSRLNQSLLLIAKIDNLQFYKKSPVDLKNKLENKIKEFSELWASKNIELKTDLSDAYIDASPELIDIMLNNLLSNSCKHNFICGSANIELKLGNLKVINTGRKQPLDTQKLFTRFYKESHDPGNNGLGLSIVKKICDQSGITPVYNFRSENGEHIFTLIW